MKYTPLYTFGKSIAPLLRIFFRFQANHTEYLPKEGPVVICCNHTSMKDPLYLSLAMKRQVFYMAKAELFENKFVSKIITALGAFPVHRGQGDSGAMDISHQILRQGKVLGIFIEGTRSKDGSLGKPKSGAVMLAHMAHAPVLPVCITAKDGKLPKLFHKVMVSCGELISPEELGITEGTPSEYRQASRLVMGRIQEMRAQDVLRLERR